MSDNIIIFSERKCQTSQEGELAFEIGDLLIDAYERGIPADKLALACIQGIAASLAAIHEAEGNAEQAHRDIAAAALAVCGRE